MNKFSPWKYHFPLLIRTHSNSLSLSLSLSHTHTHTLHTLPWLYWSGIFPFLPSLLFSLSIIFDQQIGIEIQKKEQACFVLVGKDRFWSRRRRRRRRHRRRRRRKGGRRWSLVAGSGEYREAEGKTLKETLTPATQKETSAAATQMEMTAKGRKKVECGVSLQEAASLEGGRGLDLIPNQTWFLHLLKKWTVDYFATTILPLITGKKIWLENIRPKKLFASKKC